MSYRLRESENRSQTTERNKQSPKRIPKQSIKNKVQNWLCQANQEPYSEDGVPGKLKSQCHLGPGFNGTTTTNNLDTRREGISLLDGKKWRH